MPEDEETPSRIDKSDPGYRQALAQGVARVNAEHEAYAEDEEREQEKSS